MDYVLRPVGESGFYLQLTEDINDIDVDRLRRLRDFLRPLLSEGSWPFDARRDGGPLLL